MNGTTFQFEAIGTHWKIELAKALTFSARSRLLERIMQRIDAFDRAYSRFRVDSWVNRIANRPGIYELPPDGPPMLLCYERAYRATSGKVTPLIGRLMEEAGYDREYSLVPKALHPVPKWEDALAFDGLSIELKRPALLDFGAAGKGYLIDLVGEVIHSEGYEVFLIDAGADILHVDPGGDQVRIGLEHPLDTTKAIGSVTLANRSIAGSAGNRRAWADFTHIIDPDALSSPRAILATWAIAENAMLADMLATCLFFASPEVLKGHFSFDYIVLFEDLSLRCSPELSIELF